MSGSRAQERLEKLRTNLHVNGAAKWGNVAAAKTSGAKSKKRGSDILAPTTETQKKMHETVPRMRQAPAEAQVADRRKQETPTQMGLNKRLANIQSGHLSKNLGTRAIENMDKCVSDSAKSADITTNPDAKHGYEASRKPSRLCLAAALPETKSHSQQLIQKPKFKIPKKPAVEKPPAAGTKRVSPSRESVNNADHCTPAVSKTTRSDNPPTPTFEKSVSNQNLARSGNPPKLEKYANNQYLARGDIPQKFEKSGDSQNSGWSGIPPKFEKSTNSQYLGRRDISPRSEKSANNRNLVQSDVPPKLAKPANNQNLAGILRNMRPALSGRLEPPKTAPNPPQTRNIKRKNMFIQGPADKTSQPAMPSSQDASTEAKQKPQAGRNMFKRKAPGSVPDVSSRQEAARTQLRSRQNQDRQPRFQQDQDRKLSDQWDPGNEPTLAYDHAHKVPYQSSEGFSKESNKKQLRQKLNAHKPKPVGGGGFREMVSRAYNGVLNAVKETASAYYCSRSEVSKELQSVRRAVETVEAMDYEIIGPTFEEEQVPLVQTDLYLVVDTCVVIDDLDLIKGLKNRKIKGVFTPKIVVPWQVLKELDYLKDSKIKMDYVSRNARRGITYLMEEMSKYEFVSGQPTAAALRELEDFPVEIPDDHLIKCCLQLRNNGHNVMLLTNDKNLVMKGVVNQVPSWRSEDFINSCPEHEPPQPLSPFETPPAGSFAPDQLPLANAAHQIAVLLKNFLHAVLKKFLTCRFTDLWMLRIPGNEPWCLTTLLETVIDYWHEIAAKYGARTDVKDTLLFLRRFIHKVAYDRLRYTEVDQFARCCHQLAVALPPSFGVEGVCLDNRLAFWKYPHGTDPPSDVTFSGSCVNLTIHHMQLFENNLVQYCFRVSQASGVPFSHSKLELCLPGVVDLNNLPKILATVKMMGEALTQIPNVPLGSVVKSSDGVSALWSSLVSSLGDAADSRFLIEDVVEFCNSPEMRHRFPEALQGLEVIASFLTVALRRLPKT